MVKLIMVDGSIELTEERKEKLLQNSYFNALFLRWSKEKQKEYEVNLTVNTVKFLLGEISQLDIFTQLASQVIDEARQELDMVGASTSPIDVECRDYPFLLHPLLKSYRIGKNLSLHENQVVKTPEIYPLLFHWKQEINYSDLEKLVDHPQIIEYLQVFWMANPVKFVQQTFSLRLQEIITQHATCFPFIEPRSTMVQAMEETNNVALFGYLADLLDIEIPTWIQEKLAGKPSSHTLQMIVRLDHTNLFICIQHVLKFDQNLMSVMSLLAACENASAPPLDSRQIDRFSDQIKFKIREWMGTQIYLSNPPTQYEKRFTDLFSSDNFEIPRKILHQFPTYPFTLRISQVKQLSEAALMVKGHPHLLVEIDSSLYQRALVDDHFDLLLQLDPGGNFGINRVNYSDIQIELLVKYQVYKFSQYAFLGNLRVARRMCRLSLDANPTQVHSDYLPYFIEKQDWEFIFHLEPVYQKHPRRHYLLGQILTQDKPSLTQLFLGWEMALSK